MAFSHSITRSFSEGSGTVTASNTYSAGAEANLDETIPAAAINQLVNVAFPYANLTSMYLYCPVACTIKTNSSNAPAATINLTAGEAYIWPNGGAANPFGSTDVTKYYVTCSAGGLLTQRLLYDPTP